MGLSWADLAALPETYATAWTCLFRNLEVAPGQTLVVRGATSPLGQAALNMAVNAGAKVIATTRSRGQFPIVEALGAIRAEIDRPECRREGPKFKPAGMIACSDNAYPDARSKCQNGQMNRFGDNGHRCRSA